MATTPTARLTGLGVALVLAACNGTIGDPGVEVGDIPPPDPSDPAYCERVDPDPGRVTVHRLNRVEYNNTVRDLLGDTSNPADAFPQDDVSGEGFDNNADILTVGNLLMEKYQTAAQDVSTTALAGAEFRSRYLTCDRAARGDEDCARDFVETFGLHAFRRPLNAEEIARYAGLVNTAITEGGSFDDGVLLTMRALLISPNFLFRIERGTESATVAPLDDYELASRLSYFLWSSMPDQALFDAAEGGALHDPETLRAQVDRMLADEKADALYENFAGQWLHLRRLAEVAPSAERYPDFDEALRTAMERETVLFFRHVLESNQPLSTLLNAGFTYVNERLARHYGIEGVTGNEFQLVELDSDQRGGLLTQASLLTVTSHPDRTSPVKRGEWVLDNLLCEPPPDPPADVDTFIGGDETATTLRERLELHRAKDECAVCHDLMDPIGLALENYDAIGMWRDQDNGVDIDATGELPGGQVVDGARDLGGVLQNDDRYAECVTKKLLSYSLGRSIEAEDRCYVEAIIEGSDVGSITLRELMFQVVQSEVFTATGGRLEGN